MFKTVLKQAILKRFRNVEVLGAEDEREAISAICAAALDLVIMDISLSNGTNGLALSAKIKRECPELVITVLSQFDSQEYRQVAQQNGVDHYFPKSAPLSSILHIVDSVKKSKQKPCEHS